MTTSLDPSLNAIIRRTLARRLYRCAAKEEAEGYIALASLDREIARKLANDAEALEGRAKRHLRSPMDKLLPAGCKPRDGKR